MESVEVGEDAVFICEHRSAPSVSGAEWCVADHDRTSLRVVAPPSGSEERRPTCGPTFGCLPRRIAFKIASVFGPSRSSYGSLSMMIIGALTQAPRHSISIQENLPSAEIDPCFGWMC